MYFNAMDVVQASISDSADYQNLPMVYNMEEECHPQTSDNLETCTEKAWHIVFDLSLKNNIGINDSLELDECYNLCLKTIGCVAVQRQISYRKHCQIFNKTHEQEKKGNVIAHFLKCCSLKDIRIIQHNFQQLPIVFDATTATAAATASENCMPQTDKNLNTCEFKVFQRIERKVGVCHRHFRVNNHFECMNKCLEDSQCKSYFHMVDYEFNIGCCLTAGNSSETQSYHRWTHVNQMVCCKVDDETLWKSKSKNLLMLYQPNKFCKILSQNNANCKAAKIWHVEDELRMKGHHYKVTTFDWLKDCLNECSQNAKCVGVSVDWTGVRCLFFKEDNYTNFYGQKRWTSYTLKCCEGFKNKNDPKIMKVQGRSFKETLLKTKNLSFDNNASRMIVFKSFHFIGGSPWK